nr:2-aminobenzoate-CoA ligase [Rubrivivax sp.]
MPTPAQTVNPRAAPAATAHVDTFARDRLPPPQALPQFLFDLPGLQFGVRLNCATELLDHHVAQGRG